MEYERGRTGWPDGVVEGVEADHVLDLAAGTGKLTRLLTGHFPRVTAVEPLPAMRALGARLVPDATWLDGMAEAIPLDDGVADAAFVGEAYHWFDTQQATLELARVLRSGSPLLVLFTVWNGSFEPGPSVGALEAIQAVASRTGPTGGPKWAAGAWQEGFLGAPFDSLVEREIAFEHVTDQGGVIAYYMSMSSVAARPEAERNQLRSELQQLVPAGTHRLALSARIYETRRR